MRAGDHVVVSTGLHAGARPGEYLGVLREADEGGPVLAAFRAANAPARSPRMQRSRFGCARCYPATEASAGTAGIGAESVSPMICGVLAVGVPDAALPRGVG